MSCADMINPDEIHVKKVDYGGVDSEIMTGTITKGDGSDINFGDRHSLIHDNASQMSGTHFVSTSSGSPLDVSIPVRTETDEERVDACRDALDRAQTWHADTLNYQKNGSLTHDITKKQKSVTKKGTTTTTTRIIVPTIPDDTSSTFTRSFALDRMTDDFYDGKYHPDSEHLSSFDANGKNYTVLDEDDYGSMLEQVESRIKQKTDVALKDGFMVNLNTPNDEAEGLAYVTLGVKRTPVGDVLAEELEKADAPMHDSGIITPAHVLALNGEEVDTKKGTATILQTEEDKIEEIIFGEGDTSDDEESGFSAVKPHVQVTSFPADQAVE